VTHPPYLRDKARQLRVERRMTVDEIAERLALPKTTVWSWISDLPAIPRAGRANAGQRLGNEAMQRKYRLLREAAYAQGLAEFDELCGEPTFRDFVCLYIAEGYKRSRNHVAVGNSDAAVIRVCDGWIRRFGRNRIQYAVQYHADQDLDALRDHWAGVVGVAPEDIRLQRKSNSSQLAARTWRSVNGVLTISTGDTGLRARLGGWLDRLREEWV
jgi:hypothetical protein